MQCHSNHCGYAWRLFFYSCGQCFIILWCEMCSCGWRSSFLPWQLQSRPAPAGTWSSGNRHRGTMVRNEQKMGAVCTNVKGTCFRGNKVYRAVVLVIKPDQKKATKGSFHSDDAGYPTLLAPQGAGKVNGFLTKTYFSSAGRDSRQKASISQTLRLPLSSLHACKKYSSKTVIN